MPSSILSLLLLFSLLHSISAANFRRPPFLQSLSTPESANLTTYFEVTKPIPLPKTKPLSYPILIHHEFAYTYNKPPVSINYKPPPNPNNFSKIVLEWTATCKGRQYDRIFGVWIGGAEVFRSCTAEPRTTEIVWTVKKDITRYRSLLTTEQTVSVYMGNIIDATYTGIYHVNLTFHFYPSEEHHRDHSYKLYGDDSAADLILPISRNLPLNDGLWFKVENSTSLGGKSLKIPQNSYRAVLEIYVSFHENDEFWFGNFPNEYINVNNLTDFPGNGAFREVVVHLNGVTVGAVWPFTVIFTGGVNPYLWRPISAIGSFDLPSYDIDVTPFLGKLLDEKLGNKIEFSVTNGLNVWYIDANLHLWLDKKVPKTRGELVDQTLSPLSLSLALKISGSHGLYAVNASRVIVSKGWVESSHGVITTESRQEFRFNNSMVLKNQGDWLILDQIIKLNQKVRAKNKTSSVFSTNLRKKFVVSLYYNDVVEGNKSKSDSNVTLGVEERSRKVSNSKSSTYALKNLQKGEGFYFAEGKTRYGWGRTQQNYKYVGDGSCYYRKVRSSNYTILQDKERKICKNSV